MAICTTVGPGPGAYKLKPLIGCVDHDYTRYRNPCYSFGARLGVGLKSTGPGPNYDLKRLTRFGPPGEPQYSFGSRLRSKDKDGPGPAAYYADKFPIPRKPAWSMAYRVGMRGAEKSPGPAAYMLPCRPPNPAYTMAKRIPDIVKRCGPGPAQYNPLCNDRGPQWTIRQVHRDLTDKGSPGPAAYYPCIRDCIPHYSFGIRHTCRETPLILLADALPCVP